MADNTRGGSNDGSLPNIATREVTYSGDASVKMQVVGLANLSGADDAKVPTDIVGGVALPVGNKSVEVTVTPTLDTSVYASGDCLHTTVITFANAVGVSGGSGTLDKLTISDHDVQSAAGELWLFNATVTPAAANAAHSISDADADKCIGVVPFGPYYASALNSISVTRPSLPIKCAATSMFGILVTRGTPTYTASGLVVTIQISQD